MLTLPLHLQPPFERRGYSGEMLAGAVLAQLHVASLADAEVADVAASDEGDDRLPKPFVNAH